MILVPLRSILLWWKLSVPSFNTEVQQIPLAVLVQEAYLRVLNSWLIVLALYDLQKGLA